MSKSNANGTQTKADFLAGLQNLQVELTYEFGPAIIFPCKVAMNSDDIEARQAFYKQPEGDQETGRFNYHVDMLARIVVDGPEGLPGFPVTGLTDLPAAIREYFGSGEDILRKIANDAIERYNVLTQPKEFFR